MSAFCAHAKIAYRIVTSRIFESQSGFRKFEEWLALEQEAIHNFCVV